MAVHVTRNEKQGYLPSFFWSR